MWWTNLGVMGQIFFCIAIAATLLLLIQSIFMFFGGDGDMDADGADMSIGDGLHLFSLRGIVAFFAMGGWAGVVLVTSGIPEWLTILISLAVGTASLFVMALIVKAISKLQSNGVISLESSIGKIATVYLKVPKKGEGSGKINLELCGRYSEMDAISLDEHEFKVGEAVKVVGVLGDSLIISKIENNKD